MEMELETINWQSKLDIIYWKSSQTFTYEILDRVVNQTNKDTDKITLIHKNVKKDDIKTIEQ